MEHAREAFGDLVGPGGGELAGDLDYGAALIAQAVDPSTDVERVLQQLDALAATIQAGNAEELSLALFGGARPDPTVHFRGNQQAYYDARNSLLPQVLERRLGIPITLSVVLIEVGRRCGIRLDGVGMPGHFLVGTGDAFLDCFHGGMVLSAVECEALFQRLIGRKLPLPEGSLRPSPPALILKRMLNNLSAIATNNSDRATLRAVRSLVATFPDADHRDHIQHAYAAAEFGQYGEAASAAERALPTVPEQVRPRLESQMLTWQARLN